MKRRKCQDRDHQPWSGFRDEIGRLKCGRCLSHVYVKEKGFVYVRENGEYYYSEDYLTT